MKLRKLIEGLNFFERERIPNEIRLVGIVTFLDEENGQNPLRNLSSFTHCNLEMGKEV